MFEGAHSSPAHLLLAHPEPRDSEELHDLATTECKLMPRAASVVATVLSLKSHWQPVASHSARVDQVHACVLGAQNLFLLVCTADADEPCTLELSRPLTSLSSPSSQPLLRRTVSSSINTSGTSLSAAAFHNATRESSPPVTNTPACMARQATLGVSHAFLRVPGRPTADIAQSPNVRRANFAEQSNA